MARALNPRRRRLTGATPPRVHAPNHPLQAYLTAYRDWALAAGYSPKTLETRCHTLGLFIAWCDERGLMQPHEITRPVLERYQRHLYQHRKPNGQPLSVQSQLTRLTSLRMWFSWLTRERHVLANPAADLELPRRPRLLPKSVLTIAQVETLLNQADPATPLGVRNRAILEVFYSSGIRRMELVRLNRHDVDTGRGTLMVRQGKGGHDRFIPLGSRACRWLERYLVEVRPQLVAIHDDDSLFLDERGGALTGHYLWDLVRRHIEASGLKTEGACHVFRHACATHMLEGGADIRYVQAMLGHADISTTQIYTRVSMTQLKAIHEATHPARIERRAEDGETDAGTRETAARAFLDAWAVEDEAEDGAGVDDVAADAQEAGRR